jgi:hypothetical protein
LIRDSINVKSKFFQKQIFSKAKIGKCKNRKMGRWENVSWSMENQSKNIIWKVPGKQFDHKRWTLMVLYPKIFWLGISTAFVPI